VTMSAAIDGGT